MKKIILGLALTLGLFSVAGTASADLLINGGFETGNFSGWTRGGNTGFTGVTSSSFDNFLPHSGKYFVYLGPVGTDGILSQGIVTTYGSEYLVGFWLGSDGGTTNDFTVKWDNTTIFSQTNIPSHGYTYYSLEVTGTGNDTLAFYFRNDPGYLALDEISVNPTPEPATMLLFGAGLAGLARLTRRRLG